MTIESKNWKKLSITKLVPADWNYKKEDKEKAEKLKNNIKRNGQIENIIVRKLKTNFYEVVNGNHRLQALKDLDYKKVICYSLGKITDNAARRIAIETNETRFQTDELKLAGLINEISGEDGFDLEEMEITMPFDLEELQGFKSLLEYNWDKIDEDEDEEDDPGDNNNDMVEIECPSCNHKFSLKKKDLK